MRQLVYIGAFINKLSYLDFRWYSWEKVIFHIIGLYCYGIINPIDPYLNRFFWLNIEE